MTSARRQLATLLAAATLSACGGGGGSSAPVVSFPSGTRTGTASAGADLDAGNFSALSTQAVQALLSTVGGGDALGQSLGADRARAAALGSGVASRLRINTLVATGAVRAANRLTGATRVQPLAVSSETFDCSVSGSLMVSVDDADNNNKLSAGDSATFAFDDCVEQAGTPAIDGSFSLVFNALVLDAQQQPTAFDAGIVMTALSVQGLGSLNGSARIWVAAQAGGSERSLVRYLGMQSTTGSLVSTLDFDVDETATATTSVSKVDGAVRVGGQTYVLAQLTPFDTFAGDPSSGRLRIVDAQGDRVEVVARGTLVDREFYLSGNTTTTPDASIVGTPWSSFRQ